MSITALNAMPDKLDMPNAAAPISGPAVVIQFADAGCGIAPEQLEQVFEPFFTTKPLGKGTGLGLSQVQGFCSRSNGFVAVESTVGVGTLFKLWFPAASETASMAPNPAGSAGVPTLNCRILLVEDNDELAAGVEQLLLSLGCTVKRAASADAGAALLEHGSNQFDLVLSDVATPGMLDGIALAELVRSRFPRIEVMLMSGYAERLETAVGQGFTVLTKPSSPHTIAVAIAAKLNKRAAA